tara:strand:- start:208 stop:564 length:357 start_codon:yes stop_codon:yes gene_type:complete
MSLETQIEQLTTAINTLNATLAANIQPVVTPKPDLPVYTKPELTQVYKPPVIIDETKADATIVSAEELKMLCLQTARAKPGNKDKIKALLLRYDSNKIADLDIKHYVEVFNLIEKGKF